MLHSFYQHPGGGEDVSFDQEVALLRSHGDEVFTLTKSNDGISDFSNLKALKYLLWDAAWSRKRYEEVRLSIQKLRPDIAHVQNFWFMLSPSVHGACHSEGVAVVQHLRNYRLGCLNGLLLYRGQVCKDCLGRRPWRGLLRRCYHDSLLRSWIVYHMIMLNRRRRTWQKQVVRFICLTQQSRDLFVRSGLPRDQLIVRPNFVSDPGWKTNRSPDGSVLYVGRLSQEKGFEVLVSAWKMLSQRPVRLKVCGGQEDIIRRLRNQLTPYEIELAGHVSGEEVVKEMKLCRFLVMPTLCNENMPRVVVEAFACGTPVVGSDLGAVAEMIEHGRTGLLFKPGDPLDLAQKMSFAFSQPEKLATMGCEARREYEAKYSPEQAYVSLIDIYQQAREQLQKTRRNWSS